MFPVEAHISMLADKKRTDSFRQAIFQKVKPGDHVVDIGTGTGILAFFALQAGAERVYAIETGDIIEVARKIAKDNGLDHRIEFIHQESLKADLETKVDLIITETIGSLGIDEGIVDIVTDARTRFLKPGGEIIPAGLSILGAPVSMKKGHPFRFLEPSFYELNFSHLKNLAANEVHTYHPYVTTEHPSLLAEPSELLSVDFQKCEAIQYPMKIRGNYRVANEDSFHGHLLFPTIFVTEGDTISLMENGEFVKTHWSIPFFPIPGDLILSTGNTIDFELTISKETGFIWKSVIEKGGQREVFTQLSAFGLPSLKRFEHHKPQPH
jgi:protein arginine N-methyltransferase 1